MDFFDAGAGLRADLELELKTGWGEGATAGRVIAQHTDRWLVAPATPGEPALAHARGRLRQSQDGPPVTGDWVALDAEGAIVGVLSRRGAIVRRAAGSDGGGQMLAANVDLALVVEPLPEPNLRRAERFAAIASAGEVSAALVLTKSDLDPDAWEAAAALARRLGLVDGVAVSSTTGEGVATVRAMLSPGSTAVLLGASGAGKSTLANALLGDERQATGEVRASDGRGRHTTVVREMLALPGGALLIDTPGLREVGLWEGAGTTFGDIDAAAEQCRFSDCAHESEPGCGVRGTIDPERIEAWRKLAREQLWIDDRKTALRHQKEAHRALSREWKTRLPYDPPNGT
jgi:ribosome biogenesis GTPase / thiamine phosphate phosphatase